MLRFFSRITLWIVMLFPLASHCAGAQPIPPSVETGLTYTGEVVAVPAGGLDPGLRYLDNVDVTATVRSDSLIGWSGLTAHLYGLGNQGGTPSTLVGDAQVTSNIEAPLAWRLYEAWLQQTWGTRASVLVGLYDLNAEFDVNRTGSLFLNSAHGIGTAFGLSGRNGPSIFPVTSLAARLRVRVARRGYVQAAVMDGVPGDPSDPGGTVVRFGDDDGVLVASEAGVYLGSAAPSRTALVDRTVDVSTPVKLAIGGWAYTTPLRPWPEVNRPGVVPVATRGSAGAYLLAEGRLRREPDTDEQGLSGFVRLGWANDRYNRFSRYVGAGLVYTGPFPGRNADRVGLAVASAFNGDAYQAVQRRGGRPVTAAETNVEATYAAPVTPWLTLIGDVQYVINPNTDPSIPDALLGGIRVVVEP
jgi:porin